MGIDPNTVRAAATAVGVDVTDRELATSVREEVCDRVAVMYLGEIVEHGTTRETFEPPYHPYTEALLSAIPGRGTADEDRIVLEGDVPDPSNVPSGCRSHPRCPHKIGEVCEQEVPEMYEADDDHEIHCHLLRGEYREEIDWATVSTTARAA